MLARMIIGGLPERNDEVVDSLQDSTNPRSVLRQRFSHLFEHVFLKSHIECQDRPRTTNRMLQASKQFLAGIIPSFGQK